MKTSKEKTIRKSRKPYEAAVTVKNKKDSARKSGPSVEEIRAKAMEIYQERISRGEMGNAESDWINAEKLLMGSK